MTNAVQITHLQKNSVTRTIFNIKILLRFWARALGNSKLNCMRQ